MPTYNIEDQLGYIKDDIEEVQSQVEYNSSQIDDVYDEVAN